MPGVDRSSSFMRWLYSQPDVKTRTQKDCTHLLLCGGMLHMNKEQEENAYQLLADDIENNKPNYLVEKRTPVFRFCQDYDFVSISPHGISKEQFLMYLKFVQKVMRELFPELDDEELKVIVLRAENKKKRVDDLHVQRKTVVNGVVTSVKTDLATKMMTKSGFHTVWPKLFVNRATAIRVRFALCQALRQQFPDFALQRTSMGDDVEEIQFDTWTSVLDYSIYIDNGLRMVGSNKAEKCTRCNQKNTSKTPCELCFFDGQNRGYTEQGRPYIVMACVEANGSENENISRMLFHNAREAVRQTSLRVYDVTLAQLTKPSWFTDTDEMNALLDKIGENSTGVPTKKRKRTADGNANSLNSTDFSAAIGEKRTINIGNRLYEFEVISLQDNRAVIFERFINSRMQHGKNNITLRKIMISTDSSKPYILAVSATKWCLNVAREHNGQDIFYIYNGRTVEQRCWSMKDGNDRLHGPCTGKAAIRFFHENGVCMPTQKRNEIFPAVLDVQDDNDRLQSPVPQLELTADQREISTRVTAPNNVHPEASSKIIQYMSRLNDYRRELELRLHLPVRKHIHYSFGRLDEDANE
uniref:C962R-like N-terminal AEP domain-containing protein n=1 Tax=viral metagenome TaxID=1070528 RepID=A0A6C0IX06_9ZZZZ